MRSFCEICHTEQDLRTHLKVHGITAEEYYIRYLGKPGVCPVCGKLTKFMGISAGYRTWCSNKCHQNDPNATASRVKAYKLSGSGRVSRKSTWDNKTADEKQRIVKKTQKSVLEKFDTEFFSQTDMWKKEVPNKISESNKSLGKDYWNNIHKENLLKYCTENNLENTNCTNISQLSTIKDKIRETKFKKYGDSTYNNIQKIVETNLTRYGVKNSMQRYDIFLKARKKYRYDNKNFDSAPEIAYYIWLCDNHVKFEYQPDVSFEFNHNEKTHLYFPDFIVDGRPEEIKGTQFFENGETNGRMINPFNRDQDALYEAKHQCMLKNGVRIITENEYVKYIDYVNNRFTPDFLPLFSNKLEFPFPNADLTDTSDMGVIKHFHKSIYMAHRANHPSPFEAWNDKSIIMKVALNRLKYIKRCRPSDILQGFNVTKCAPKVSVFNPKLATELISEYLSDYKELFDPFSGFSGRLIGAMNTGKYYVGRDINETHVAESQKLANYRNYSNCDISVGNIFDCAVEEHESLFTCPPYGLKEIWNENEFNLTCDQWIDECLRRFKCKKYMFVVDETTKYSKNIVKTIVNKSHFGKNSEYVILI